jgi:hypothetical protein
MGAGALAPGRVCTEFPKDKEFRAFEMLEKIEFSLKPGRCAFAPCARALMCTLHNAASQTGEGVGIQSALAAVFVLCCVGVWPLLRVICRHYYRYSKEGKKGANPPYSL